MRPDIGHPYRGVSCPSGPSTARTDGTKADMSGMSGLDLASLATEARHQLGQAYGLGRPLCKNELARLIGLQDGPGNMIAKIESGRSKMSGPVYVVITLLLAGHRSPRHGEAFKLPLHVEAGAGPAV